MKLLIKIAVEVMLLTLLNFLIMFYFMELTFPHISYQTDRYVAEICHSSVKYLQNICTKVSVTNLQHIGIWPHNISVTVM